jgi:uncharacterized protein YlbG (UPF0298 family)
MARSRNIKPSFFQNEELGELSPITRLAFIGMWTIANYQGCIEYRPKRLKVQLLPYDDCNIQKIVNDLDKARLIRLYSVYDIEYIKIINFEKHQNPHKNEREAGTDIPDFDEKYLQNNDLKNITINRDKDGTTPADSLLLNPDSLLLIPESKSIDRLFGFEDFWSAYDHKKSKPLAQKAWKQIEVDDDLLSKILHAVHAYVRNTPDKQYRKHPTTWLNQKCWEDEITESKPVETEKDRKAREFYEQLYGKGVKDEQYTINAD